MRTRFWGYGSCVEVSPGVVEGRRIGERGGGEGGRKMGRSGAHEAVEATGGGIGRGGR